MKQLITLSATALMLVACNTQTPPTRDYASYVDPMIGTGAHYSEDAAGLWGTVRKQKPIPTSKLGTMAGYDQAHDPGQCIPAVFVPHGMNFWVAQTEDTEQKEISPYYYQDQEINGFRNSHWIVGGMTQDYGTFTFMPMGTELRMNVLERGSRYSHDQEVATPSYYSVLLQDYGIQAEMTSTVRAAIFRLTYREAGDVYLAVNPNSDEGLGRIAVNPETGVITGSNPAHRIYQGWGEYCGFDGHFCLEVNKPLLETGVYDGNGVIADCYSIDTPNDGRAFPKGFVPEQQVHQVGAFVKFHVEAGETVLVRAASSFTDIAHAQDNLAREIPAWDFDSVRSSLADVWQTTLGVVEVDAAEAEGDLVQFYTSLYHASFLPRTFNDCDGSYPSYAGGETVCHTDGTYYDDYSMWDTYRAMHPLKVLIDPDRAGAMVQSLLDKYQQGGWLPIFPCWNSYTSEMIGDHCCSLIADAWLKGVRNFDIRKATEALLRNAFMLPQEFADYEQGKGRRALDSYRKYGYIPVQDPVAEAFHKAEQSSRTMEYAYDDYCLASLLESLLSEGRHADIVIPKGLNMSIEEILNELHIRAGYYRNVIGADGWVDGRNEDGTFVGGDPFQFQKYICEGKPCHYTFYAPHDPEGLIEATGGREAFISKLDHLFNDSIYWHGNEPCHQIAYMYALAGAPDKTRQWVANIIRDEYGLAADGLAGNDDAGQMSAWYVFSAMGFYPVCPGKAEYVLAAPLFSNYTIHLPNGNDLQVKTTRSASSSDSGQVRILLNGNALTSPTLSHSDIMNGGLLEFCIDAQ